MCASRELKDETCEFCVDFFDLFIEVAVFLDVEFAFRSSQKLKIELQFISLYFVDDLIKNKTFQIPLTASLSLIFAVKSSRNTLITS